MNAQELLANQFACGADEATIVLTGRSKESAAETLDRLDMGQDTVELKAAPETLVKPTKDKRFVLDNFSDIVNRIGWDDAMAYLDSIKKIVNGSDETAMIIAYDGLHTEEQLTRLKIWADGVMELGFDRQGFGLYPFLKISKMRGSHDSTRFLLFKETPSGIFMESTRRVF
jgi:KaiC/GvpD/RAD55 family RecA-like ATPase